MRVAIKANPNNPYNDASKEWKVFDGGEHVATIRGCVYPSTWTHKYSAHYKVEDQLGKIVWEGESLKEAKAWVKEWAS